MKKITTHLFLFTNLLFLILGFIFLRFEYAVLFLLCIVLCIPIDYIVNKIGNGKNLVVIKCIPTIILSIIIFISALLNTEQNYIVYLYICIFVLPSFLLRMKKHTAKRIFVSIINLIPISIISFMELSEIDAFLTSITYFMVIYSISNYYNWKTIILSCVNMIALIAMFNSGGGSPFSMNLNIIGFVFVIVLDVYISIITMALKEKNSKKNKI